LEKGGQGGFSDADTFRMNEFKKLTSSLTSPWPGPPLLAYPINHTLSSERVIFEFLLTIQCFNWRSIRNMFSYGMPPILIILVDVPIQN
jgi:hypothetical protein